MYIATTNSYATGSKTRIMINSNGKVGIGTTSPDVNHVLTVAGGSMRSQGAYFEGNVAVGYGGATPTSFSLTLNGQNVQLDIGADCAAGNYVYGVNNDGSFACASGAC